MGRRTRPRVVVSVSDPIRVTADPDRPLATEVRVGFGSWPFIIAVGSSLLGAILATVLCLNVSERNAQRGRESRAELLRTQCALIVSLDDNYRDLPPTTELGRRNAATMTQLRTSLGCAPPQP